MAEVNKQRLKLLYLMEIFSKDTDDEHMLTLPQIITNYSFLPVVVFVFMLFHCIWERGRWQHERNAAGFLGAQ